MILLVSAFLISVSVLLIAIWIALLVVQMVLWIWIKVLEILIWLFDKPQPEIDRVVDLGGVVIDLDRREWKRIAKET